MATSSSMWMIMLALFLILSEFEAKEHLVGDSESSWLLHLSQAHCLMIGDSLSWKYDEGSKMPVLQVKEEHYHNCNKSNPIQGHVINNGHVRVVLNKPGPFYFISGTQDNCELGLKLHVRVLSNNMGKDQCEQGLKVYVGALSGSHFDGICHLCHPTPPKSPPPSNKNFPSFDPPPPKSPTPPSGKKTVKGSSYDVTFT